MTNPQRPKVIDCSEPEAPESPVFGAGRDSKMEGHQPDNEPAATPKLTYGKKAARQLGQSKIDGYRGQSEKPIRKRAPDSVLKAKAESRAVVAEWQASSDTGHKVRRDLRKCEHCKTTPIPYKKPLGTKHCSARCHTAAARKLTAESERNKVFQTAASIAQERADADQRLYNYCEVAAEMQQSADRIGRDDVIFFATPGGVIVANDGEPLPRIRVTVYAHELMPRNVQMQVAGHKLDHHASRHR